MCATAISNAFHQVGTPTQAERKRARVEGTLDMDACACGEVEVRAGVAHLLELHLPPHLACQTWGQMRAGIPRNPRVADVVWDRHGEPWE